MFETSMNCTDIQRKQLLFVPAQIPQKSNATITLADMFDLMQCFGTQHKKCHLPLHELNALENRMLTFKFL